MNVVHNVPCDMRALIIDEPWLGAILRGEKTWEMRTTACHIRGLVGLIRKGSGAVVGVAKLVGSLPPIESLEAYADAEDRHRVPSQEQPESYAGGWKIPWVLADARPLERPVPYRHPRGAVIWVVLDDTIAREVEEQCDRVPAATGAVHGAALVPIADRSIAAKSRRAILADPEHKRPASPSAARSEAIRHITLTGGNLRNKSLYVPLDFFPPDAIGGRNKDEAAPRTVAVTFRPGTTVDTDIDATKRILRARGAVADFLAKAELSEGDRLRIIRTGPYAYELSKDNNV